MMNVLQLVAPYPTGTRVLGGGVTHEFGISTGAAASVLICWVLIRRRALGWSWGLARGAVVLGGLALLLAFGEYGYVYRLQTALPVVGRFEAPARHVMWLILGGAKPVSRPLPIPRQPSGRIPRVAGL